jgi:hypothetical protein
VTLLLKNRRLKMKSNQFVSRNSPTLEKLDMLMKLIVLRLIECNERLDNYRNKSTLKKEIAFMESFEKQLEKHLLWCLNRTQELFNTYKNKEISKYEGKNSK